MQSLKAQVLNILAASATAGVAIAAAVALPSPAPVAAQPAPTGHDQAQADVVYVPEREEYVLVWVEDRGAGNRIFAKRVRANGLPVGGRSAGDWELTGATGAGAAAGQKGDQLAPAIIGDLVVWSEKAPAPPTTTCTPSACSRTDAPTGGRDSSSIGPATRCTPTSSAPRAAATSTSWCGARTPTTAATSWACA